MPHAQSLISKLLVRASLPATCLFAVGLAAAPALAAPAQPSEAAANRAANAQDLVSATTGVIKTMDQEPQMSALLKQAKGVLVIPQYGNQNDGGPGRGVVLFNNGRGWSDPAFYNFRSISLGPTTQYGSLGSVVLIAVNQHALDAFKSNQPFAIGRDSGLTVANYQQASGEPTGHADFVMWTDLYRDFNKIPTHVAGVQWNGTENDAYYGHNVDANNIMNGAAKNAKADTLTKVLPG
jgi:lipid-binding SYLF domain-containing protein